MLCRAALGPHASDAPSFTLVRLFSGALVLALLAAFRPAGRGGGSWASAGALFTYALAFSLAYRSIPAGVGALVLFGSVQATMIGREVVAGRRPLRHEWIGLVVSLAGLLWLASPGKNAPDPLGVALMAAAGVAWGVYSLCGRGAAEPLAATADNFVRSVPLALLASLLSPTPFRLDLPSTLFALASGTLASGLGYVAWYGALRGLTATRAAIVQLAVPPLAAGAGVLFLGETLTARLLGAGLSILGGIALAVVPKSR